MDFIKTLRKKKIFWVILIIIFALIVFSLIYNKDNEADILYRTYTKENGWTKWVKNGQVSGKKGNNITAIEIKVNSKTKGSVFYDGYINGKWTDKYNNNGQTLGNKKDTINGLKVLVTETMLRKYNVYYTTRNKEDDWMAWNSNSKISGNSKYPIDQIRIILNGKKESFDTEFKYGRARSRNFK